MKKFSLSKMVFIVFVFCAATVVVSPAQSFTTLYSFCSQQFCTDGEYPLGRLVQATDGDFYGTTWAGGVDNVGAVYKLTPSGTLTVMHGLTGESDGAQPYAGVIQGLDGNFYGVDTIGGGTGAGCGALYKVTPSGTTTSMHVFGGYYNNDGCNPWTPLLQASDGNFYGTTYGGGTSNVGTVFKMTAGGTESILHSFCTQTNCPDGDTPLAGLIPGSDGFLYGETTAGGANNFGTIFKIAPSGSTFATLHSFKQSDGDSPAGGLLQASDGNFYGTTLGGGAYNGGTVFKMTPDGQLTTLYSFCYQEFCPDGSEPYAGLIQASDGNFYGTTYIGGNFSQGATLGTIFSITPSGTFTTIYRFCAQGYPCPDGAYPYAGLIQASDGNLYGVTKAGGSNCIAYGAAGCGTAFKLLLPVNQTLTVSTSGNGKVTSTDGIINCPGTCSHSYPFGTQVTLDAAPGQGWIFGGWNGSCVGTAPCTLDMTQSLSPDAIFSQTLQLVTVTPCRVVDTRNPNGPFGGPAIMGGTSRSFPLPQGSCNIPATAAAYSLNVTVVPGGPLGYLTIWPTGENQPVISTMNSLDGRVKANAAIVPAGTSGAVSVYVTDSTHVVLDIDGYFAPTSGSTLAFYPLTPCRIADTRKSTFPQGLGLPHLSAKVARDFPILNSPCIPNGITPAAYSFNFTAAPYPSYGDLLGYLEVWPTDQKPTNPVSTLNNQKGTYVANAAIVPAGTSGKITTYVSNDTDLVIDINGYFAPAGTGGLSLYPAAPCRVVDTRKGGGLFGGDLTVNVVGSPCEPPTTAQAYVFNATVVPSGGLGYLTLWPDTDQQPYVSTLNAVDGMITSNMAIVPNINGKTDAFASGITQLILDLSSYFAP